MKTDYSIAGVRLGDSRATVLELSLPTPQEIRSPAERLEIWFWPAKSVTCPKYISWVDLVVSKVKGFQLSHGKQGFDARTPQAILFEYFGDFERGAQPFPILTKGFQDFSLDIAMIGKPEQLLDEATPISQMNSFILSDYDLEQKWAELHTAELNKDLMN